MRALVFLLVGLLVGLAKCQDGGSSEAFRRTLKAQISLNPQSNPENRGARFVLPAIQAATPRQPQQPYAPRSQVPQQPERPEQPEQPERPERPYVQPAIQPQQTKPQAPTVPCQENCSQSLLNCLGTLNNTCREECMNNDQLDVQCQLRCYEEELSMCSQVCVT